MDNNITEAERLILKAQQVIMAGLCVAIGALDTEDVHLLNLMAVWCDMSADMNKAIIEYLGEDIVGKTSSESEEE